MAKENAQWDLIFNEYLDKDLNAWVSSLVQKNSISSEMVLLPLLAMIAGIAGQRIQCAYGLSKRTNLCSMIVLAAPSNSRKSVAHRISEDALQQFELLVADTENEKASAIFKASINGKLTRAGLITFLNKNTLGRKSVLLNYDELTNCLDWFGNEKEKDTVYIDKVVCCMM